MNRYREHGVRVIGPWLATLVIACGGGDDSADAGASTAASATESSGTTSDAGDGDSTGDPDTTGDGDATGSGDGDTTGDGDADAAPEVREDTTYSVTVTELSYGQGPTHSDWGGPVTGTVDLMLDVYEPVDAPPGRPAMVVIHGGGFTGGSKTAMAYVALSEYFAERGWVVISIDYRITDDRGTVPDTWIDFVTNNDNIPANFQDQIYAQYPAARDAKAAIRWLHASADTYKLDLDYITVAGGSAGGIQSVTMGVSDPEDFRDEIDMADDPTLSTTNLDQAAEVHTVIDYWGSGTQVAILESIDGVSRFDASDPPMCIVHGTADETVPIAAGEALRDTYIALGIPYAYYPLEGAGHGPWEATFDGQTLHELAFDFIVEQQGLTVVP